VDSGASSALNTQRTTIKFDTLDFVVNSTKFISASELSREVGCSVGKILSAVESGVLTPAGKAGNSRNAAMIFMRDDVASIKATLDAVGRFKAVAITPRPAHRCRNTSDILEKGAALARAKGASK
jgi:hypothetical protein